MKKTSLVIAATAAALFVAGCATQAETTTPAPVSQPANACKGMSSCKAAPKKHRKHHHAAAAQQQQTQQQSANDAANAAGTQSN